MFLKNMRNFLLILITFDGIFGKVIDNNDDAALLEEREELVERQDLALCKNGDVKLEGDGTPLVFWDNSWMPICGHYFWDNQNGAKLFCEKMGYTSGKFNGRGSGDKYSQDSFKIGKCNDGDKWESCSGGCNEYESGGKCDESWGGYCTKDEEVKITIECSGGESIKTTSCRECNNEIKAMTCSASSEYNDDWLCKNAIDGKSDTDWATRGKGTGSWIQLNFGAFYKVETIRIKHRSSGGSPLSEMFKGISLEFSDGKKVDFTLNNIPFTSGLVWNDIVFPNDPMSDYVKITATSVYGTINNGFSDIRVYGCREDKNCVKWRQTGNCKPDGPRESQYDKSCYSEIQDGWSGYCECSEGRKALEKGCGDHIYSTCNEACKKEVAYRAPAKRGACSTKKGQDTKFYERCQCSNEDMSTCKAHCDEDENCKGFVGPTEWNACQWATTSECPTGCSKYDEGSVGNILLDEEYHKDNYPGCFVKLENPSCPHENGYCVKADGLDQNSGVIKLNDLDGNTWNRQEQCLRLCRSVAGVTGCEVVWDHDNRGCYAHTQEVASGSGADKHFCWVFSKCDEVCLDTPFWENGHGHNCASYESQWCENEGARAGQEWTLGAKYHYPENNCCACGKKGKPTAIDCEWNDWELGMCSKPCGGGTRTNTRTKKSEAENGGKCEGEYAIEEPCNTQSCPAIHCQWDEWVHGECSKSCGTGTRTNTRVKLVVEENGGTCSGKHTEVEECNTNSCPVDCEWDEWQTGECDEPCGGGMRTNTRVPKVDAQHGGEECTGSSSITESCNVHECPVDCIWGEWFLGECSAECGGGIELDFRHKIQEELFGGKPCEGEHIRHEDCNTHNCPIDCEWNDWQLGDCSVTCGGGIRVDTRTKTVEEQYGGICDPMGNQREEPCNTDDCPAIHCVWNDWVSGECSSTCGVGSKVNTRTKLVEEANGGSCTGQFTETEECNLQECPVHCEWDEWQVGECSKTCGGGLVTKKREEKVSSANGGNECEGEASVTESCNVQECPVDCDWGDWMVGECSEECGEGVQVMSRTIKTEAQFGGKACEGESSIEETCNIRECPAAIVVECEDGNSYCPTYFNYYGDRYCADTPANQWFVGEGGRYACRKSCGLC